MGNLLNYLSFSLKINSLIQEETNCIWKDVVFIPVTKDHLVA